MNPILEFLGGGLVRMIPEVIGVIDKYQERKHELRMLEMQASLERVKGEEGRATMAVQAEGQFNVGVLEAWQQSIKAQAQQTNIKWVDAINALVRPGVTILFLGVYGIAKIALTNGDISALWTEADNTMLFTILGFWFVNRSLIRK